VIRNPELGLPLRWYEYTCDKKDLQNLEYDKVILIIKANEMHRFLKFIFGIELFMFWTGFLSIIRSLVLLVSLSPVSLRLP